MQLSDGNSSCQVNKVIHSPNRTNRPNRQACKGSLSLMRCNFRMENTICQIENNIFHSSNRTNRNSTCRVVNKIFHSPNRTNRLNRQTCKGSLSIMRCNCRIENSTCRIVQKCLYSPKRTNRSNRTSVFSDRIQLTVLDMDVDERRSQYTKRELERTLNTTEHPNQVFISTHVFRNYSLRSNQQINVKIPR